MATSTYTTETLVFADNGKKFRAKWTNVYGTVYTDAVTITVQASGVSYMWIAESFTPVYHWSN